MLSEIKYNCLGTIFEKVVTVDGVVYAWGSNVFGQVGDGTTISKSSPTIISGTSSFVTVSAKANQTFAITTAGKLFAWGRNSAGELGDGTKINKSSPTQTATSTQELNVYADSDQNTWSQITDSFGIKNDGRKSHRATPKSHRKPLYHYFRSPNWSLIIKP